MSLIFPQSILVSHQNILEALERGEDLTNSAEEWVKIERCLHDQAQENALDEHTAIVGSLVAHNMYTIASEALALQIANREAIHRLTSEVSNLFLRDSDSLKRSFSSSLHQTPLRQPKRQRAHSFSSPPTPITRDMSTTPSSESESDESPITISSSPMKPSKSSSETSKKEDKEKEVDHHVVRLWFLDHLSKPYPTLSQKEKLAESAGITRNKVDSDLTNFRRRSGWTEIMQTFAGGDRDKMKKLIERVQSGKENNNKELLEKIEGMKDYLGRREEERVGDWVREVTALTSSLTTTTTTTPAKLSKSSKLSKHKSNASLSSLSTVSNLARPASRSRSSSSTMSTSSSASDASFIVPSKPTNKKRLNPNAEPFTPNKRYVPSSSRNQNQNQDQAEWLITYPAHTAPLSQPPAHTYSLPSYDPSMWSTTTSIPLLPHMSSSSSNTWSIPFDSIFQPSIEGWNDGNVIGVNRTL
ncbi:uncharacterized protein L201_003810 [Kwoniella dendrophila CBS 6074]|uniref:KN homeodomain domain-containing protein n=1 Tax=Kwoniella dendrophila CBS 6074 TaxID=1295534 RepID=A0AAX4JWH4_9TREE